MIFPLASRVHKVAVSGAKRSNSRIACPVLPLAAASKYFPRHMKVISSADVSKKFP
jgi:hypothetical protein